MAEGFLDRWSQRKQAVREGKGVVEPSPPGAESGGEGLAPAPAPEPTQIPAPTLEDVKALTLDSNFAPFVARDVAPEVRNAAMKKLFADPHYNVMDRLDIYIDDYSKPDPLPETMLRKMVSAKFLNLFEEEKTPEAQLRDDPHTPSVDSVAQSGQSPQSGIEPFIEFTSNDKTAMLELAAKSGSEPKSVPHCWQDRTPCPELGSDPNSAKP